MSDRIEPAYVDECDQDEIVLVLNGSATVEVQALGFAEDEDRDGVYTIPVEGDQQKAEILSQLRDEGVAFSTGREWSPSEVFEYLRDKGLLAGAFTEIYWTGPGRWGTRTNDETNLNHL